MSVQSELEVPRALSRLGQEAERHVAALAGDCGRLVMDYAEVHQITPESWQRAHSLTCGASVLLQADQVFLGKKTVMPSASVLADFSYMMRPGGSYTDVDRKNPDVCHVVVSGQPTRGWAANVVVAFNTVGHTEGSVVRNRNHRNELPPVIATPGVWGDSEENFGYAYALRLATAHTGANIVRAVARHGDCKDQAGKLEDTMRAGAPLLRQCIRMAGRLKVDFLDGEVTIARLLESPFVRPPKEDSLV